MRLLWIRHGQMDFDGFDLSDFATLTRLFNQQEQASLSDRGRAQAEALALHWAAANERVDAIYSSTMLRAKETAEASARVLDLPVSALEEIVEVRAGRATSRSASARVFSLTSRLPVAQNTRRKIASAALIPLYFKSWYFAETEGGESRAELEVRLRATLRRLRVEQHPDATVALFAHGYLIFYLSAFLCRSPSRRAAWRFPYVENCSITEMALDAQGPPRLISFARPHGYSGSS